MDGNRILIDEGLPDPKKRWIEAHEIGHSFIPWHRDFLFGDDEYTLDPECHANVEAEANYAASRLLFMQDRFGQDCRDLPIGFESIKKLSKRYGNTLTTTLWRAIEERDASKPAFGMVSAHPHYDDIGREGAGNDVRYFIRSDAFRARFGQVTPAACWDFLSAHASRSRKGPLLQSSMDLFDSNGARHQFDIESFCNQYAVLTYATYRSPSPLIVPSR